MSKLKRVIFTSCCALMLCGGTIASAAGYESYVGYSLPKLQGDTNTNTHSKTTNDAYMNNKVTDLANTNSVNCWVETSTGSDLSTKYNQKVSSSATKLNFKDSNSSYAAKGQQVRLGLENASVSTSFAFVAGEVDFR